MRYIFAFSPCFAIGILVPSRSPAYDYAAGASVGAVFVGTRAALAVTPHLSVSIRTESGFVLGLQGKCSLLPASNNAALGVHAHVIVGGGYVWERGEVRIGPSFGAYSLPVCRNTLCGRVSGAGIGGDMQASYFFAGPLGASLSVSVDWLGGSARLLPGGVAAAGVAGPVLRW